jgi:hypothetical protein
LIFVYNTKRFDLLKASYKILSKDVVWLVENEMTDVKTSSHGLENEKGVDAIEMQ